MSRRESWSCRRRERTPAWSTGSIPRGNNGNFDIWAEDADGGPRKRVTDNPDDSISPAWAPPDTICTVPKLKDKTLKKAKELINQAGCKLGKVTGPKKHRDKRHVVKQDPGPNHNVHAGTKVNVKLG